MKNEIKTVAISTIIFSFFLTSCAQDKTITKSELPRAIITYLETYFPNDTLIQATVDKELFSKSFEYEVVLENNINLNFNSKYKVVAIGANSKLPDNVIPKQLLEYAKINYPNNVVIEWELDDKNQELELENGINLEFNRKGDFLRIDN